ncbi:MAG: tetratricopeptide repeat protein [Flavobacteriales bacterium]|nr:tetratricopeptide repeat protein [Flavobacteriales bacterium]
MGENLKKLLFIPFFLLLWQSSFAQDVEQESKIDSLKEVIRLAKHDSTIVNAWKAWDNIIYSSNPELDFELNQKIEALCRRVVKQHLSKKERHFFKEAQGSALNVLGIVCTAKGDNKAAIDYYTKSLAVREEIGDQEGIANSLNNLGIMYADQGNYVKGIDYYTKSLKIEEERGDSIGIATALNNIGTIYSDQFDYDKAIEYHSRSLKINQALGRKEGIAASLHNVGTIYLAQSDDVRALQYHTQSLKIYESINHQQGIANSLNCIGLVHKSQGDYTRGLEYFNESLKINEEIGMQQGFAVALGNIGNVYAALGDYNMAIDYNLRCLKMSQKSGAALEIKNAAEALWESYRQLNRHEEALEMYELFVMTKDSLESEANQEEVIRQEYKYNYEKIEALAKAEHVAEIQRQELESSANQQLQKIVIVATSVGLCLVILFLIFLFNRLRVTKKQKEEIGKQKAVIEIAHKETEKQKEMIEESHREITDSINYAKRLQDAILPSFDEVNEHLPDNFIHFQPKDVVSGDFYWFERMGDYVYLAAADCTGHGVPGAMVSVVCSNALNRSVKEFGITAPAKILDKTRELVIETFAKSGDDVKDGMDIALCAFDLVTGHSGEKKVVYSGANNPLWIVRKTELLTQEQREARSTIIHNGVSLIEHKSDKQPIGLYQGMKDFTQEEIELYSGDSLYLFTDGFADQFGGEKGKKFMYKPFKKFLIEIHRKPMAEQRKLIAESFEIWKGNLEQVDDVCIIGIHVR